MTTTPKKGTKVLPSNQRIKIRRTTSAGTPSITNAQAGELVYQENSGKKKLFIGNIAGDAVIEIAGDSYAKLDSAALTGTPTAPTPINGDNSTKIATTAFVTTVIAEGLANATPGVTIAGDFAFFNNTTGQLVDNGYSVETNIVSGAVDKIPNSAAILNSIQAAQQGISVKQSVLVATTASLSVTSSGTGRGKTLTSTTNGALSIDGVSVFNDVDLNGGSDNPNDQANLRASRVLVKNQTNAVDNGIYIVKNKGSSSSNFVLIRAIDMDNEAANGTFVFIEAGTTQVSQGFIVTATNTIAIDTDSLTFVQFTGVGDLIAGTGLSKTGNTISIANGGVTGLQISSNVALAGNPTTTTQSQGNNSDKIATTQYVDTGLATKTSSTLTSGKIYVGNDSNVATQVTVSGDATIANNGVLTIANGVITADKITPNSITGDKIASNTITATQIVNNTITSTQIANNTITATQIASNTITGDKLSSTVALPESSTATTQAAGDNSTKIATTKYVDTAVSALTANLGSDLVHLTGTETITGDKTFSGNVDLSGTATTVTQVLGDNSTKIATTAFVDRGLATKASAKLLSGKIYVGNASGDATQVTISGDATIANDGTLTLTSGAIDASNIQDGIITGEKISDNAITEAKIVNNTITAGKIVNKTITATQIADSTITATQIVNNTITAGKIVNKTITATQIADNAITGTQIVSSVALEGAPTAPTPTVGDISGRLATTEFVDNAFSAGEGLSETNGVFAVEADITTGVTVAPVSVSANGVGIEVDNVSIIHTAGVISVSLIDGGVF
jgi:hypothetical protein